MAQLSLKKLIARLLSVQSYDYTKFTYPTGFEQYSTSGSDSPSAYKNGRIVMLKGAIRTTAAQSSTGAKKIAAVPAACKPIAEFRVLAQGSSMSQFLLKIATDGSIYAERYGTTTDTAIPSGVWLNISCAYISAT